MFSLGAMDFVTFTYIAGLSYLEIVKKAVIA